MVCVRRGEPQMGAALSAASRCGIMPDSNRMRTLDGAAGRRTEEEKGHTKFIASPRLRRGDRSSSRSARKISSADRQHENRTPMKSLTTPLFALLLAAHSSTTLGQEPPPKAGPLPGPAANGIDPEIQGE